MRAIIHFSNVIKTAIDNKVKVERISKKFVATDLKSKLLQPFVKTGNINAERFYRFKKHSKQAK